MSLYRLSSLSPSMSSLYDHDLLSSSSGCSNCLSDPCSCINYQFMEWSQHQNGLLTRPTVVEETSPTECYTSYPEDDEEERRFDDFLGVPHSNSHNFHLTSPSLEESLASPAEYYTSHQEEDSYSNSQNFLQNSPTLIEEEALLISPAEYCSPDEVSDEEGDNFDESGLSDEEYEDSPAFSPTSRDRCENNTEQASYPVAENKESPSSICSTPEYDECDEQWERTKNMTYTARQLAQEVNAANITARDHKDRFFTFIHNETSFIIVVPFGCHFHQPLYKTVTYPVGPELMNELSTKLPSWTWFKPSQLSTLEGFIDFARRYKFKGSVHRQALLMRRALKDGLLKPMLLKRIEEEGKNFYDISRGEDDLLMEDTPGRRRRQGRSRRDAAAAVDGRTPFGRRRPMQPLRLFEEERQEQTVKRRRIDFDD